MRMHIKAWWAIFLLCLVLALPAASDMVMFDAVSLPVQGLAPQTVAIADFNGDRIPDLAVAYLRCDPGKPELDPLRCPEGDRSGRLALFAGAGRGAFRALERRFVVGESPKASATGDFNGDGIKDIVVANFGLGTRGSLSVLLGDGRGGFSTRTIRLDGNASALSVGDFNGDKHQDIVVALTNLREVALLLGDGRGNFSEGTFGVAGSPLSLASGDFNRDKNLDVATANLSKTESISILLGDGKGGLKLLRPMGLGDAPFDVVASDFNSDGLLDLATSHAAAADSVFVLLGDGRGNFKQIGSFPAGEDPIALATVDFNGDGKQDVVAVNGIRDSISILLGDGTGRLGAATSFPVGKTPVAVSVADLNGDGKPDIVTANQGSHDVSILLNK